MRLGVAMVHAVQTAASADPIPVATTSQDAAAGSVGGAFADLLAALTTTVPAGLAAPAGIAVAAQLTSTPILPAAPGTAPSVAGTMKAAPKSGPTAVKATTPPDTPGRRHEAVPAGVDASPAVTIPLPPPALPAPSPNLIVAGAAVSPPAGHTTQVSQPSVVADGPVQEPALAASIPAPAAAEHHVQIPLTNLAAPELRALADPNEAEPAPGVDAPGPAQPSVLQATPLPPRPSVEPGPGPAPSSVVHQMAPALVQLAHGPSGNAVTLRLDPADLGHVQIRVERDPAGTATVQVTAERPETLHLLKADQPQLHRALDSAGLPGEGRTLTFALHQPSSPDTQASGSPGGASFGGAGGSGTGRHAMPGRQGRTATQFDAPDEEAGFGAPPGWIRAGVDITA